MIQTDLTNARTAWIYGAGGDATEHGQRDGLDLLAEFDMMGRCSASTKLRHTRDTWASMGGASIKAVQTLMRHTTITLTMDTYGHLLPHEAAATVQRMPEVARVSLRLTSTDDDPIDQRRPAV